MTWRQFGSCAYSPRIPPCPPAMTAFQKNRLFGFLVLIDAGVLERLGCYHEGLLNVTYIALRFARFVNGVALQHGKVCDRCFRLHHRLHHERRACDDVDFAGHVIHLRPCDSSVAYGQFVFEKRDRYT